MATTSNAYVTGARDRGQRRSGDMRRLLSLGFEEADLRGLQVLELRRLARWTARPYDVSILVTGVAFGVVLGAAVFVVRWPTSMELPEALTASSLAVALSMVLVGVGGSRAVYWLQCAFDRFQSFGDAGAKILRWIRPPVTQRLFRKEQCLRLTRRWAREGARNGLALALQEQRIMELLAGELTPVAIEEIHDLVRDSLLDAAYGRFDPQEYVTGERWTYRRRLRLAAEVVAFVVLAAPAAGWLINVLAQVLRGSS